MPHFAEEMFTDDPEQLEALRRLLHGAQPGAQPGAQRRPGARPEPPTLESRFGAGTGRREAAGRARRAGPERGLLACRASGSE